MVKVREAMALYFESSISTQIVWKAGMVIDILNIGKYVVN